VRRLTGVISTDDILPARYKHSFTDAEMFVPHLFENILPGFSSTIRQRDVIAADNTFGVGSSREQAVSALIAAGVVAVIAPSFGRIFFRNAWNLGLFALEVTNFPAQEEDLIQIHLEQGLITGAFGIATFAPVPNELIDMVMQGGLLAQLRRRGHVV
jgi:3-isopropylmalate/(R)-2-methylmalate dehydratase small subunit